MKILVKYFFLSFLTLILLNIACKEKNKQKIINISQDSYVSLEIIKPNNDSIIHLSNFINEVKIVPLEFRSECMLGNIKKVAISNENIFIQDSQRNDGIYRFDMAGKFICKIGNLGKGPAEHITLTDFSVNPVKNTVYIYSNAQKKIIEYSINNELIKEIHVFYAADNFEYKVDLFYFYRENPQIDEKYNLIIKNTEGKSIARFFKSEPEKKSSYSKVFLPLKDKILFHSNLNDTIYCINGKSLEYFFYVNYGKNKIKTEDHLKIKEWSTNTLSLLNSNNYIAGLNHLMYVSNLLVFTYVFQNVQYIAFYNSQTQKIMNSNSIMDDLTWFSFSAPIAQTDEYMISVYDPSSIKHNIKNIEFHSGKLIPVNQANDAIEKLHSYVDINNVHELNPFLIFYKVNNYEN